MSTNRIISIFDVFKIGIGPSSSHTLGPWLAALNLLKRCNASGRKWEQLLSLKVELYGSLACTGIGHQTDKALMLGLMGHDPKIIEVERIAEMIKEIQQTNTIVIDDCHSFMFNPSKDILVYTEEQLAQHPNGIKFKLTYQDQLEVTETYYSTGGGFIEREGSDVTEIKLKTPPYAAQKAQDIFEANRRTGISLPAMVLENEQFWYGVEGVERRLNEIWRTMQECVLKGFSQTGVLPGGLKVRRRASEMIGQLLPNRTIEHLEDLCLELDRTPASFIDTAKWISLFAISVNEVNASMGRIVTSPTNGAAGVIPAVLLYAYVFEKKRSLDELRDFLLTAGEVGTLFIKSATISAAVGGCQAEIGVSSAMAAAGLTHIKGGTLYQVMCAAEIAMEHHLGLTCDPIAGLVQIPCIERNAMGAMKAITASELALSRKGMDAKVSLDEVIATMWATAQDMSSKYKETSKGGLSISVAQKEC